MIVSEKTDGSRPEKIALPTLPWRASQLRPSVAGPVAGGAFTSASATDAFWTVRCTPFGSPSAKFAFVSAKASSAAPRTSPPGCRTEIVPMRSAKWTFPVALTKLPMVRFTKSPSRDDPGAFWLIVTLVVGPVLTTTGSPYVPP